MVTEELKTIREMCEEFDVTPRTLRFYEAKELLSPIREGQKRLFTRKDRGRLKLILRGKRFGFSLEEIRELLGLYELGDQGETQYRKTFALAQKQLAQMESQRDELIETISDLKKQLEWGADQIAKFEPEN